MANLLVENYQDLKSVTFNILNEGKESGEDYEKNYKKSGKKSKDYDEDGEVEDEADEYAGVKDNAIKNALKSKHDEDEDEDEDEKPKNKKKSKIKESYSNWRSDLYEKTGYVEDEKPAKSDLIKEKKVNNKIEINPSFKEATSISKLMVLESYELDENYLETISEHAAKYFYNQGLNEDGVNILFGHLGEDKFIDFVYDICESTSNIFEARLKPEQKGLPARSRRRITGKTETKSRPDQLKGAAASARSRSIESMRSQRAQSRTLASPTPRQARIAQLTQASRDKSLDKAKKEQSAKPASKKGIGNMVLNVLDRAANAFVSGVERHNKAMKTAGELSNKTKETAKKAAPVVGHFLTNVPKGTSGAINVTKKLLNADTMLNYESEDFINETGVYEEFKDLTPDKEDRVSRSIGKFARNVQVQGAKMKTLNNKLFGKYRPGVRKAKKETINSAKKSQKFLQNASDALIRTSVSREAKNRRRYEDIKQKLKDLGEDVDILEMSPPSPKFERMVKHIKKRYSDGGLTEKEKQIAYATAWKAYNRKRNKNNK